jgi:flagellar protein FlaJ
LSELFPKRLLPVFSRLKNSLIKAGIKMSFSAYLGLTVLASLVTLIASFAVSLVIFSFSLGIVPALVFSVLIAILAFAISVGICYSYPAFGISSRAHKIDANLPLIANFMSVLAGSGMPPERVMRSLANVGDEFNVGDEARRIVADIELMGLDLNTALRNASLRSPSRKFGVLLDGVVTSAHTGGDMASFLQDEAAKFKKTRMQSMKGFLESLALIAEAYVSFMIALPLVLVIMLSVMSFIGGGAFIGGIDPQVLLIVVTFVLTPAGVAILLLLVDSMTPPR